jgi:hypothetical protein
MKRREFNAIMVGAAAMWPLVARAQEAGRFARVGVLGPGLDNPVTGPGYQAFLSELRKLGFTEGQNVIVESRRTDEGLPKAFTGANELVAAKADVLVANGPEVALQAATAARPVALCRCGASRSVVRPLWRPRRRRDQLRLLFVPAMHGHGLGDRRLLRAQSVRASGPGREAPELSPGLILKGRRRLSRPSNVPIGPWVGRRVKG